ncbi:ImmA/IrrE family metallo-endopeptidase [Candidatus Daviesbacteria bacterium]|nr:ImmA/IrrE family metallo-endopeptidase [Candidatus Daviesbacteria bacterium]
MNTQNVIDKFRGKILGNQATKKIIAETLLLLPEKTIEDLSKHVWFMSSFDDAWAYTFRGNDLKGKKMIFLSDELLSQDKESIQFTILHEVGHVVLNHRNSINFRQTREEVNKQEQEADKFAFRYLNQSFL